MRRPQALGWLYFIKPVYGLKSAPAAENPARWVSPWPEVNARGVEPLDRGDHRAALIYRQKILTQAHPTTGLAPRTPGTNVARQSDGLNPRQRGH